MSESGRFVLYSTAGTGLLLALLAYPVIQNYGQANFAAVATGCLFGLALILISFFFNRKALLGDRRKMFSTFFTGVLLRFALIVIALFVVAKTGPFNIYAFAAGLLGIYLILQAFEVRYMNARLLKKTK